MSDEPIFDPNVLNEMLDLMGGDLEIVDDIANTWLDEAPELVAGTAEGDDAEAVRHHSHTLKSSSRSVGAMRLGALCEQIEHAARAGSLGPVDETRGLVNDVYQQTRVSLADWRANKA